ncbi:iron-containing alcohol dehydrogenase [Geomonas sp. Red69]|uniref:Iron-containing alcohol dehydrogenase n=1 Tax=Geomonas diazotrophica TaxID=2843197 RepID=A0ABX8JHS5_9BACT|nr:MULTISPECIES: alcohol dehydrogenase-like regulatory protein ErcA [Geomonas]MBU5638557.1 iron-containing alcohol dehydrogenase [Geomonas diazotrophica]QWV97169.1 iron-containing alcohol dehydrogenase [Geomonas nitrogeniifigens]QXE86341.1 iron-containing alcohol dehydrogenase [Geomonas nitrogeniifigens]
MAEGLQLRKFLAPEFIFGVGARELAGRYAKNLGGRKVLVVSDPGVVKAGWTKDVTDSLDAAGVPWVLFTALTPNPKADEVMAGVALYQAEHCDALVAVGGGSPIDCAKGIGIVSSNHKHILEFEGVDMVKSPMPPLICIPTTGGTSADVSQFAIISNPRERVKIAIISKSVVPDIALIDPVTLITMDPYLTACTGLDAMTHAIEAFVSTASSSMTDLHALEALRLLSVNLIPSIRNLDNEEFRSQVMMGSLQAGLAFSNAILGANHAMAHSLGGALDLAHGECNAILLDHVIDFNFDAAPERFEQIAQAFGLDLRGLSLSQKKKHLLEYVRKLKAEAGVGRTLAEVGVGRDDLKLYSEHALKDPCMATNPRRASKRDIEVVYEESL